MRIPCVIDNQKHRLVVGFGTDKHNAYYEVEESGLTDILLTVSSTFKLDESFSVTPFLALASIIDQEIADAFDAAGKEPNNMVLGVTLSYGF